MSLDSGAASRSKRLDELAQEGQSNVIHNPRAAGGLSVVLWKRQ